MNAIAARKVIVKHSATIFSALRALVSSWYVTPATSASRAAGSPSPSIEVPGAGVPMTRLGTRSSGCSISCSMSVMTSVASSR